MQGRRDAQRERVGRLRRAVPGAGARTAPPQHGHFNCAGAYVQPERPDVTARLPETPQVPVSESGPLPENWFSRMAEDVDYTPEEARVGDRFLHVSSLVDMCPRQHYLAGEHEVPVIRAVTGGHRVMYAIGRAVEAHFVTQVLTARDRWGMFGNWRCGCGLLRTTGLFDISAVCVRCDRPALHYSQPVLENTEYMVRGSPDLTLLHEGRIVPVEVKSMNRDQWAALSEPLADHVLQVLLYRWLYESDSYDVHWQAALVYIAKDFVWGNPYKEYHVDATEDQWSRLVDLALERAETLVEARRQGQAPVRQLCNSPGCARARNCPVAGLCFNAR